MGKRDASKLDAAGPAQPIPKRPRLANDPTPSEPLPATAHELRQLIIFHQDDALSLVHGIRKFRSFLAVTARGGNDKERLQRRSILLECLKLMTPEPDDRAQISMPGLFQAWSYAAETSRDDLLSVIPSFLTLLLNTISSLIEFRDVAVRLCQSILTRDSLRSVDKGLDAHRSNETLTVSCLKLLTEVVSFDGGACARQVYNHRYVTWKKLSWFLGKKRDLEKSSKRAAPNALRRNALKYILVNLRLQSVASREELVSIPNLFPSIFKNISNDPPGLITEALDTIKDAIVMNQAMPRAAKTRLFSERTLFNIAELYKYRGLEADKATATVCRSCHEFLLLVCTSTNGGLLGEQSSWYVSEPREREAASPSITVEPAPDDYSVNSYAESTPHQDRTLATFAQTLRPHADLKQRELLLAIFRSAPGIVADYFATKTFSLDPTLSAAWVGHAAFIASVQKLACPSLERSFSGRYRSPPPASIALQSIFPRVLNQSVMTKCLNHSCTLIKLLTLRLIIQGLRKASVLLDQLHAGENFAEWEDAAKELVAKLSLCLPEMKHVAANFRSCSNENAILKQSLVAALSLYVRVVPQLALQATFDISVTIAEALLPSSNILQSKLAFQSLDLADYLEIAFQSTEMRWWNGPEKLRYSPFVAILRGYVASDSKGDRHSRIGFLLRSVATESHVLQQDVHVDSFGALVQSMQESDGCQSSDLEYELLDNCMQRVVKRPLKYAGDLHQICPGSVLEYANPRISLLLAAVAEQWPYFIDRHSAQETEHCAQWLARLLTSFAYTGEEKFALRRLKGALMELTSTKHVRKLLETANTDPGPGSFDIHRNVEDDNNYETAQAEPSPVDGSGKNAMAFDYELDEASKPPSEPSDHSDLHQWQRMDIADAVEEGSLAGLVLCLCSGHEEVRRQALVNSRLCMSRLQASRRSELAQTYLLIGEVVETAKDTINTEALPSLAGAIAAAAFQVLNNPLHFMFDKVNKFLNKGPSWDTSKLPSYWVDRVLHQPPESDDGYAQESEWLLDVLMEGLRTSKDIDLYRRCGVFERVMSLCSSKLGPSCSEKVVRLLYRCTFIEGSTTLVTRCGALAWIRESAARKASLRPILRCLARRVLETCDAERLRVWSGLDEKQLAGFLE